MTPAQITGTTFRGGLLRGVLAAALALLVIYGVLFLTADEQTVTAQAPCEQGTAVSSPADNPRLVGDCAILLAAKDTLRGSDRLNWSADRAITSWEGITVSGTPGRVTRLVLDRNTSPQLYGRRITLTGTIPAALGGLSKLQRLTLARHELTGTIPVELANLSELTSLQLYGNDLTGGIPPELGSLSNLTNLSLGTNPLGGAIPVELGKLSNLRSLRLANSQLTGSIPASLGALANLYQLNLYGNTGLTGCIPASLRGITLNDLGSLGLEYCTTTTTYSLTVTAGANGRVSPLPGTYRYLSGASVTVTATPDAGYRVTSWGGDCSGSGTNVICALTMDGNKTASVTFEQGTAYTLTTTAGEGGSVTPGGTTTHHEDAEVTLTASWNDATHSFTGWGGDCDGTASTCELTMDGPKTVTATFAALAADRCAEPAGADCIRAVYLGAPGDYAQVSDIPAEVLLTPATDGRYYVERGRQVTVVTAAPLPTGWTRFYLQQTPLGTPSPVSFSQLIKPVGTTYTFTPTTDPGAPTLITFDLKQARPFIRPRPDGKPEIGDTVVTTVFSVEASTLSYGTYDTTGAVATAGSYAFVSDPADTTTAVTTYEALRDGTTTALLIHKSDAHGASQTALYDSAEAGDLFEWRKADDCFVRYTVTEVKLDPTVTVPRKLLAVEWMTYAFTGCYGTISTSAAVGMTWGDLRDLGGVSLPAPVVHGGFQISPENWEGRIMAGTRHDPPAESPAFEETSVNTLAAARAQGFPYWREPSTLPEGWELFRAWEGGLESPVYGFCSVYVTSPPGKVLQACGAFSTTRRFAQDSSYRVSAGQNVRETRVIGGRPAMILWSPPGPEYVWYGDIHIRVFDPDTEGVYGFIYSVPKRSDSDANAILQEALDLVTSFFESDEDDE